MSGWRGRSCGHLGPALGTLPVSPREYKCHAADGRFKNKEPPRVPCGMEECSTVGGTGTMHGSAFMPHLWRGAPLGDIHIEGVVMESSHPG